MLGLTAFLHLRDKAEQDQKMTCYFINYVVDVRLSYTNAFSSADFIIQEWSGTFSHEIIHASKSSPFTCKAT